MPQKLDTEPLGGKGPHVDFFTKTKALREPQKNPKKSYLPLINTCQDPKKSYLPLINTCQDPKKSSRPLINTCQDPKKSSRPLINTCQGPKKSSRLPLGAALLAVLGDKGQGVGFGGADLQ